MKLSKLFLRGSAIVITMLPFSLSALDCDDLADKIRISRASHAPKIIEQEAPASGWFSSFRKAAGNALRAAGDSLRTESDKSAAGQVKEFVKDGFLSAVSAKVGYSLSSFKDTLFNSFGNGLRTIGQAIKGEKPTQTTTRVILDNLELNKNSNASKIQDALRTVAQATLKADTASALEEYRLVVNGLVKRGYATTAQIQAIDVNAIYLHALAGEVVNKNNGLMLKEFADVIKLNGFSALEELKAIKVAPTMEKKNLIEQYIQEAYQKAKMNQELDNKRKQVIAAPAA